MRFNITKWGCLLLLTNLVGCTGLFDKDNTPPPTPLTQFTAEAKPTLLFSTKTGSGTNDEYLRLSPVISENAIFTSSVNGEVAAINKMNGQTFWRVNTNHPISSGPGAGNGIVVVGSRRGDIIALEQTTGKQRWHASISGEVLAAPAISDQHVIVKATDGRVHSFHATDGHHLWTYQQTEPSLILRGASNPRIYHGYAIVGFANGNLAKIGIHNGQAYWKRPIATAQGAFAIQRMIDIDADPIVSGYRVYAATYQGRIASLELDSGSTLWTHDISSYTGMAVANDGVFVTDATSHVWSFGTNSGLVNWRQTQLAARQISPPALFGKYVVLGDAQGYVHWLDKKDGHFAAREFAGSAIYAAPLVENGIVYLYTKNGNLLAYSLR